MEKQNVIICYKCVREVCMMQAPMHRLLRRKRWMARAYVMLLLLMLAASLTMILARTASAAEEPCNVAIQYHGKTTVTTSSQETVQQLLHRLGLEVTGEDVVSHGMEDPVCDGMELRIDRIVIQQEQYTRTVPHGVTRCNDPTLPKGQERILTAGTDGELLCTASVTYQNGVETVREVYSQKMTLSPVEEVIAVGTGEAEDAGKAQIGDGFIMLPSGEILTYTHTATIRATAYTHTDKGCDMTTATGTTVHWGTVAVDPRYIPYGTRMFIVAANGSYTYGIAVAEDCGGDIKGDRMDLYMPTYEQCMEFGRRVCTVYYLG